MKKTSCLLIFLCLTAYLFAGRPPFAFWQTPLSGPWNPKFPGDLVLWTEASTLSQSDGSPVSDWTDQSGNGNDFNVTASAPTYHSAGGPNSLPYVSGDGVSNRISTANTTPLQLVGSSSTLVLIFKTTATGTYMFSHYDSGPGTGWGIRTNGGTIVFNTIVGTSSNPNQDGPGGITINDGGWHIVAVRNSGGFLTIIVDSAPDTTYPTAQPYNALDGGASWPRTYATSNTGAELFNFGGNLGATACSIYGCLAYSKALSNVDLKNLFDYYHTKCATPSTQGLKPYVQWIGDSMFFFPGVPGGGTCVPDQTMASLPGGASAYDYDNFAVVGATIAEVSNPEHWQTCLSHATVDQVSCMDAGTNDMATHGLTPAQTLSALEAYCVGFKAMFPDVPIIVQTILPRQDSGISGTFEADRQTLNAAIRSQTLGVYWNAIADVGGDATIGQAGDCLNTTYYSVDKVHLVAAGAAIDATYWSTAIQATIPH